MRFSLVIGGAQSSVFRLAATILLTLMAVQSAFPQTEVFGEISGVWNTDDSPYIAVDSVIVPAGESLTIEAGVVVRFEGHVPLIVNGLLRVEGTEEDSVFFGSNDPDNDLRWAGIQFSYADEGCCITYAHISGAGWNGAPQEATGILVNRSSPVIRDCLITGCLTRYGAIWVWWTTETAIEDNTIEGNTGTGLWCSGTGLTTISGNVIRGNIGYGIDAYASSTAIIQDNQLSDNSRAGILLRNMLSIVEDNTISGNARGGISSTAAKAVIKGNVVSGNGSCGLTVTAGHAIAFGNVIVGNTTTGYGGGVYLGEDCQIHFYNNIVYGNDSERYIGGIYYSRDGRYNIHNCILWNNRGYEIEDNIGGTDAVVGYCIVEQHVDGEGNLNEDPGFINPDEFDFRLAEDSPARDAGNPHPFYRDTDGSRSDIGAYGGSDLLFGFQTDIEFPSIGQYCWAHDGFVLCNLGENPIDLRQLTLSDQQNFIVGAQAPLSLLSYQWFDFPLDFHPMQPGEHEATLTFRFRDYPLIDATTISLSGEAQDGLVGEVKGVWTREMSPIHVIGGVFIPKWDTLRIEPGVDVCFDPGTMLEAPSAYGGFYAIGTPDDSIRFTSATEEPAAGDWGGMEIRGQMSHCIVEYAEDGVWLDDGRIEHSTFRNCGRGIWVFTHWDPGVVSHCWIENCGLGIDIDPWGTIQYSTITHCGDAIFPLDGGYAYHNLFAFNNDVNVAYTYWIGFPEQMWENFVYLTAEGNIFYQNDRVCTFSRPHPAFRYNCLFDCDIDGEGELIGDLDQENFSSAPCDANFNITVDPRFVDPDNGNFNLREDSPCIDGGDPFQPRDPDGSWADIGPFPFLREHSPVIEVLPQEIEVEASDEVALNLANEGEGGLYWRVFVDQPWVTFDPAYGVLYDAEDVDLFIAVNVDDFEIGLYEATLDVDTNDPGTPHCLIPITARIGGENVRALHFPLAEGWNMISLNLNPVNCYEPGEDQGPSVLTMFEPYRDDVILAKDEQGRFYAPEHEFNNIPFWELTDGYMVKTRRSIEAVWSGQGFVADADVPLHNGWNTIAYYPRYELDAAAPEFYVLSPVIDFVEIAKNLAGQFLSPEYEFSNMPPWREGQGYQVRVDRDVVLNYPEEREEGDELRIKNEELRIKEMKNTGSNMSVLTLTGEGSEGKVLQAVSAAGLAVGEGVVGADGRCGLAVWGDDPTTVEKDGLVEGETFSLKLANNTALSVSKVLASGGLVYSTDGFTVVELISDSWIPSEYYLSDAYPNPFNSVAHISYGLPKAGRVNVSVWDAAGRSVATLLDREQAAGRYTAGWEASEAASGVYFIRMKTGGCTVVKKVTLVR